MRIVATAGSAVAVAARVGTMIGVRATLRARSLGCREVAPVWRTALRVALPERRHRYWLRLLGLPTAASTPTGTHSFYGGGGPATNSPIHPASSSNLGRRRGYWLVAKDGGVVQLGDAVRSRDRSVARPHSAVSARLGNPGATAAPQADGARGPSGLNARAGLTARAGGRGATRTHRGKGRGPAGGRRVDRPAGGTG